VEPPAVDLPFLAVMLGFFALTFAYAAFCDRV
jgi:hypothetical protein